MTDTDFKAFIAQLPDADRQHLSGVAKGMLVSLFTNAALDGSLVIDGKTDDEIRQQMVAVVDAHLEEPDRQYGLIINHLHSLLSGARQASQAGNRGQALVLYATWAEHWINGLLETKMESLGHPYEMTRSMIREVRFEGKLTWLVAVLGLPPLPEDARKALLRLAGARNEFVHYKWPALPEEEQRALSRKNDDTIAVAESSVDSLLAYEAHAVEDDVRDKTRRLLDHLGSDWLARAHPTDG